MRGACTNHTRDTLGAWLLAITLTIASTTVSAQQSPPPSGSSRTTTTTTRSYATPPMQQTPPPAQAPAPSPSRDSQQSELPDLIYIQPFVGVAYVHLKALSADNFDIASTDPSISDVVVTSKGSGLRYGVGAGLHIVFIDIGARLAFTDTPDFTLGTAQLEAAIAPRLGPVEPSIRLSAGYAWVGNANFGNYQDQTSVYGLAVGAAVGLDIRASEVVGFGVALEADVLNLSRSTDLGSATTIRAQSGNAVGVQVGITGHLTIHI